MINCYIRSLLVILSALMLWGCLPNNNQLTIEQKDGRSVKFTVETALTVKEQAQGLMNIKQMADDAGMLFVFEDESFRSFWMKNTLIPLDILFINKGGVIGHIHHHATPNDLTSIPSQVPSMYALEINGGMSAKLGINVGDKVFHYNIKRTLAQ